MTAQCGVFSQVSAVVEVSKCLVSYQVIKHNHFQTKVPSRAEESSCFWDLAVRRKCGFIQWIDLLIYSGKKKKKAKYGAFALALH